MNDEQFQMLVRVDTNVSTLVETSKDHEKRIRKLEKSHYKQTGVVAFAMVVVGAGWEWLKGHLK